MLQINTSQLTLQSKEYSHSSERCCTVWYATQGGSLRLYRKIAEFEIVDNLIIVTQKLNNL